MTADPRDHARTLIASCLQLTQKANNEVFQSPAFRRLPYSTVAVVTASLAAGFARSIDLPKEDFLLLCSEAYDILRSEERTSSSTEPPEKEAS